MSIAQRHQAYQTREFAALIKPTPDSTWQDSALCAQTDPDAFFPEKGGSTREPKKICLDCPVRQECLEAALARDERFGIWGGLSERERRKLKRPTHSVPDAKPPKPTKPSLPPTWGPKCGTEAGMKAHARRGEYSCDACKKGATKARNRRLGLTA